jgi:SPOR domain
MLSLKRGFIHTAGLVLFLCVMAGHGNATQVDGFVYTIQIASYQKRQLAVNAVETLKKKALDAFYRSQEIIGKGVWYRVYIDTYASLSEAEKAAGQLHRQQVISDYYIRRIPDVEKNIAPNDMGKDKDLRLTIQDIACTKGKEKNDRVSIQGDRYFWPSVTYSLQGSKPFLRVYINKVDTLEKEKARDLINGTWIKDMDIRFNRDDKTILLQVALKEPGNYAISQSFNKAKNIFTLDVRSGKTGQKTAGPENLALLQGHW